MPELRRELSLFDMTMIAIGSAIGSGIFLTPALIARVLPSAAWILGVWILGGFTTMCGALTYAELGAMMPRTGGVYVFLSEAYGGLIGFLYGWAYFLVANTGAIAALALAFSTYLGFFVPIVGEHTTMLGIIGIIFVTVINVLGVKAGGVFSVLFTILKIAGIGILVVVGLGWGSSTTTDFSVPLGNLPNGLASVLTLAFVSILWSFGGWQHATLTAAEAKDPKD